MKTFYKVLSGYIFYLGLAFSVPYLLPLSKSMGQIPQKPFPNSSFSKVSGVSLHYRHWAAVDSSKGNVILIHGFSGSTYSWRKTADSLFACGYNVVAVDMPPYGYSDKDPELNQSPTFRASLLKSFLSDVFPEKKWNAVGHSMGGEIAEAFALMYPEMTEKVVFIDALLFSKADTSLQVYNLLSFPPLQRFFAAVGEQYFIKWSSIEKFLASAYGSDPQEDEVTGYLEPLQIEGTARAILSSVNSRNIAILDAASMSVPAFAIWGADDTWVPKSTADDVLEKMKNVEVSEIKGAGHCPMETHHKEFMKILIDVLK